MSSIGDTSDGMQTMSDLPVTYIRIAGKEMNKKMKIYNVLTSLVDDLVENENNFGKLLVKLGTAPFGYRGEWLPLTSSALENVYKTCTQLQGRQHRLFIFILFVYTTSFTHLLYIFTHIVTSPHQLRQILSKYFQNVIRII